MAAGKARLRWMREITEEGRQTSHLGCRRMALLSSSSFSGRWAFSLGSGKRVGETHCTLWQWKMHKISYNKSEKIYGATAVGHWPPALCHWESPRCTGSDWTTHCGLNPVQNKQTHTITRQTKSGRICQGLGGTKLNSQLNQGCGRGSVEERDGDYAFCFHLTDCFSPWLLSGEQIRWATERERESRRESERNRVELISSPFVSTLPYHF